MKTFNLKLIIDILKKEVLNWKKIFFLQKFSHSSYLLDLYLYITGLCFYIIYIYINIQFILISLFIIGDMYISFFFLYIYICICNNKINFIKFIILSFMLIFSICV